MTSEELTATIINILEDIKALEIVTLDLSGKSSLADYIIICHGTSTTHCAGIAEKVQVSLKHQNLLPLGIEGMDERCWILLDYNSVILHIFLDGYRELYSLEDLFAARTAKDRSPSLESSDT